MKEIVGDLDGRRRHLFEEAKVHLREFGEMIRQRRADRRAQAKADEGPKKPEPFFTPEERKEFAHWRRLGRFHPPAIDYLRAQVLAMGRL